MLGLGGGLVLAPLMLELGVNPAVSAASTQVGGGGGITTSSSEVHIASNLLPGPDSHGSCLAGSMRALQLEVQLLLCCQCAQLLHSVSLQGIQRPVNTITEPG
jgi:hypothetical protein